MGKSGKIGDFGHKGYHKLHLEILKNQIPEMAHYPPRTQNP